MFRLEKKIESPTPEFSDFSMTFQLGKFQWLSENLSPWGNCVPPGLRILERPELIGERKLRIQVVLSFLWFNSGLKIQVLSNALTEKPSRTFPAIPAASDLIFFFYNVKLCLFVEYSGKTYGCLSFSGVGCFSVVPLHCFRSHSPCSLSVYNHLRNSLLPHSLDNKTQEKRYYWKRGSEKKKIHFEASHFFAHST